MLLKYSHFRQSKFYILVIINKSIIIEYNFLRFFIFSDIVVIITAYFLKVRYFLNILLIFDTYRQQSNVRNFPQIWNIIIIYKSQNKNYKFVIEMQIVLSDKYYNTVAIAKVPCMH